MGQIESILFPGYCWAPVHLNSTVNYLEDYYVKLNLEPCNLEVETQVRKID